MPYYLIKNIPVFLPKSRYKYLFYDVLKNKTAEQCIGAMIEGRKESVEAMELMYQKLFSEFTIDKNKFMSDWVHFDLQNDEASENVWDLLYDYCNYYGLAYLRDFRDFNDKLMDDVMGDSFNYPMGDIFELCIPFRYKKPMTKFFSFFPFNKKSEIILLINANEVYKLIGELKNFIIYTNNFILKCDNEIKIVPIKKKLKKKATTPLEIRNEKKR